MNPSKLTSIQPASLRAALYLRAAVRQVEDKLSILYQRQQCIAYCDEMEWVVVVESGTLLTRTDPGFKRLVDIATDDSRPFDVVVVSLISRIARNAFLIELYLQRFAKVGVRVVSTVEDDQTRERIRRILAWFDDELHSKANVPTYQGLHS